MAEVGERTPVLVGNIALVNDKGEVIDELSIAFLLMVLIEQVYLLRGSSADPNEL